MNVSMGNKNVVIGLIVLMVYLSMTFFIERTAALHGFHAKAAAVVLETKNSPNLLDHMRLYAWMFALFNIAIGVIVGMQTQASQPLRAWASWLAVIGVILYPLRDAVYFWGRRLNPDFSAGPPGPYLYPIIWKLLMRRIAKRLERHVGGPGASQQSHHQRQDTPQRHAAGKPRGDPRIFGPAGRSKGGISWN